jgi:hypothetical protein
MNWSRCDCISKCGAPHFGIDTRKNETAKQKIFPHPTEHVGSNNPVGLIPPSDEEQRYLQNAKISASLTYVR